MDDETQVVLSMTVHADSALSVLFQSWEPGTTNGMAPVTVTIDDAETWLAAMLEQVRKAKAVKP